MMDILKNGNATVLIPTDMVLRNWQELQELLMRADDETMLVQEIQDENTFDYYDFWVWMKEGTIHYVALAQPMVDTYFIARIVGGGNHNPYPDLFKAFKDRSSDLGLSSLMFSGSLAWKKKLKSLGFKIYQYTYKVRI